MRGKFCKISWPAASFFEQCHFGMFFETPNEDENVTMKPALHPRQTSNFLGDKSWSIDGMVQHPAQRGCFLSPQKRKAIGVMKIPATPSSIFPGLSTGVYR